MSLLSDEAADIIASQYRKKECGSLAAYEDQLNDVSALISAEEVWPCVLKGVALRLPMWQEL